MSMPPLARGIAGQRHAVHEALEAGVLVHGVVLGAAVVPEGDGARLPLKAARKLRLHLMLPEILEERPTLLRRPALEVRRVSDVDVERPAPRLWVRADHRVFSGQHLHLHAGALQALLARL